MSTETQSRPTRGQIDNVTSVKEQLDEQKKFKVRLKATPGTNDKDKESSLPVSVNGHTYHIKRAHIVEVPESVYLVLVQAGEVDPQRDEDEAYVPVSKIKTADENLADKGLGNRL